MATLIVQGFQQRTREFAEPTAWPSRFTATPKGLKAAQICARRLSRSLWNTWNGVKLDGAGRVRILIEDETGRAVIQAAAIGDASDADLTMTAAQISERNERIEAAVDAQLHSELDYWS